MSESAMPTMIDNVKTSPNLTLSLDRAQGHARDLRHREVGVEHLLLALTDDPDATGSLEACGVDLARLKTDIATHVSKNAGAEQAQGALEPVLSAEDSRVEIVAVSVCAKSLKIKILNRFDYDTTNHQYVGIFIFMCN